MRGCNVDRAYTLTSEDGVFVQVSETPEREEVVLSLSRVGHLETARLTKAQFDALVDLRYRVELTEPKEKEPVTYKEGGE